MCSYVFHESSLYIKYSLCNHVFKILHSRFDDKIHHYKLYYDGSHCIGPKRYETIYDLVADGLVTCHMELKAHHIFEMINSRANYPESPYVTLNKRKLNTLSKMQQ